MKRDHPIPIDVEVEPPALRTKRLHPGVVREHREIYVRGYIAGLGSPYRRPRPPVRVWIAVALATAALVLTAFWAGHVTAAPRPGPHDDVPASAGDRTGASQPQASDPPADQRPSSGVEGSDAPFDPSSFPPIGYGVPNPSGGLDAAGLCSEPTCGYIAPTPEPICGLCGQPHSGSIAGQATWWNSFGDGIYTALRPDLGSKGDLVVVCGPVLPPGIVSTRGYQFHCRTANVITSCACLGPNSDRLVDLSLALFREFADPSAGVVRITLQVLER